MDFGRCFHMYIVVSETKRTMITDAMKNSLVRCPTCTANKKCKQTDPLSRAPNQLMILLF